MIFCSQKTQQINYIQMEIYCGDYFSGDCFLVLRGEEEEPLGDLDFGSLRPKYQPYMNGVLLELFLQSPRAQNKIRK